MSMQSSSQRDAIVEALMAIRKPDPEFNYTMMQNWLRTNPEGFEGYREGQPMPSNRLGPFAAPGATQRYIDSLTNAPFSDQQIIERDPHAAGENWIPFSAEVGAGYE
jgi:hypothetical protein